MTTFVLISGAWHAGWCWERVIPLLDLAGHRATAPDLAGMGADQTSLSQISLAGWADQIAGLVEEQAGKVVLVGHSRGGIVISEVAERVPDRISALVYVAAFLVPSGETLSGTAAKAAREQPLEVMMPMVAGTTRIRPEALEPVFYNSTEAAWVERARTCVAAEPMAVFTTPLRLSEERYGSVSRAYVECTADKAIPLMLQRSMQAALPCSPVFTLHTDHSPFYSAPDQLAACLQQIPV